MGRTLSGCLWLVRLESSVLLELSDFPLVLLEFLPQVHEFCRPKYFTRQ